MFIYEIKDKNLFIKWCKELEGRYRKEALKTLDFENTLLEGYELFSVDGRDYCIAYSVSKCGRKISKSDPNNPLNIKHRNVFFKSLKFVTKTRNTFYLRSKNRS